MPDRFRSAACWLLCLFMGSLLVGCGGGSSSVDVAPGRFAVSVDGHVADTLSGPVHYRTRDGQLVGLELGTRDGPGVSIELEPKPLSPGTYRIIDGELFSVDRAEAPAGAMAFLAIDGAQFEATQGTVTVEQVEDRTVTATFSFSMEGGRRQGGSDAAIHVTGRLRAPPIRD